MPTVLGDEKHDRHASGAAMSAVQPFARSGSVSTTLITHHVNRVLILTMVLRQVCQALTLTVAFNCISWLANKDSFANDIDHRVAR